MPDVPAVSVTFPKWFPFRCVVGGALLGITDIRLDFDKRELTMYDVSGFTYKGTGSRLPLEFDQGNFPILAATFEGISGHFLVDTGDAGTLTLNAEFVAKHHLMSRYPVKIASGAVGIAGMSKMTKVRAGSLTIGPYVLKGPPTAFLENSRDGHPDCDGAIGLGVLRRFNIVFDGMRRHIFLEPRNILHVPFVSDRTGLGTIPGDDGLTIITVDPGSPADQAGAKVGDRIIEINGAAATSADAFRFKDLSGGPIGSEMKLVLRRGATDLPVSLKLRELL